MTSYLSIGSNLGNREATIDQAVSLITQKAGTLLKRSAFFYSRPWGFESEHDFCNLCISIDTTLSPLDLLHTLQSIETQLGRQRSSDSASGLTSDSASGLTAQRSYHDRPIDIDIILYENVTMSTPELTIPHPLYQQRDFVLIPLKQIV